MLLPRRNRGKKFVGIFFQIFKYFFQSYKNIKYLCVKGFYFELLLGIIDLKKW